MQAAMEVQMGGLGVAGVQMSGSLVERQQPGRACCQFAPCSMDSVCLLSNLSHKAAAMRQVKDRASRVTVLRRGGNNNRLSLAVSVRSRAGVLEPPHGTLAENSLPVKLSPVSSISSSLFFWFLGCSFSWNTWEFSWFQQQKFSCEGFLSVLKAFC